MAASTWMLAIQMCSAPRDEDPTEHIAGGEEEGEEEGEEGQASRSDEI